MASVFIWLNIFTGAESAKAAKEKKKKEVVKTYISPWEKAMKGNADLVSTMKPYMPGPCGQKDLPKYKNFNRYHITYLFFTLSARISKLLLIIFSNRFNCRDYCRDFQQDCHYD